MKIRRNILLFKLYYFFSGLYPLSALMIVYYKQVTGSYAAALGMFSIMNIVQSLAEIPTGVISDRVGRKKTVIIASFLFLISGLLIALAGSAGTASLLVMGSIAWGLANAFESGNGDALIYETMQDLRKEDKYDIVYASNNSFGQIGMVTGALIAAGVTYFYSLNLLAWIAALLGFSHFTVALFLIEPTVHKKENVESWKHFITALKEFLTNKKLRILATIQMLNRGVSFTAHRFEGAYFSTLIPNWMVNITRVVKQLCGAISFWVAPRVRKFGFYRILVTSTVGATVIRTIAVIMNNYITPFIGSCVNIFYGTSSTAESALLQKELSPKQRATMGSIASLIGGIFFAVISYFVGLVADISSVYWAIVFLIVLSSFVSAAYYWMLKKYE